MKPKFKDWLDKQTKFKDVLSLMSVAWTMTSSNLLNKVRNRNEYDATIDIRRILTLGSWLEGLRPRRREKIVDSRGDRRNWGRTQRWNFR